MQRILARRAKIAVLISGSGTNMAALLYAARAEDYPFEIVLVASNNPDAEHRLLPIEGSPPDLFSPPVGCAYAAQEMPEVPAGPEVQCLQAVATEAEAPAEDS